MTFNQALRSFKDDLQRITGLISTDLGKTINYIGDEQAPDIYPLVRPFVWLPAGFSLGTFQAMAKIQVSIKTNIDQDPEFAFNVAQGIYDKWSLDIYHGLLMKQIIKWDNDVVPPAELGMMEIWLNNPSMGFFDVNDSDPNVTHLVCDFKLLHR